MPRPKRCEQFDAAEISIVHAVQRCVRRAFFAGVDQATGKDFSFRKEWIRRRMEALASVFAMDVLSYAVISNQLHVILRNRPDVVATWSDQEFAIRWLKVFPGRRMEEHLAEPTEHDVKTLAGDKVSSIWSQYGPPKPPRRFAKLQSINCVRNESRRNAILPDAGFNVMVGSLR